MKAEAPWLDESEIADFLARRVKPATNYEDNMIAESLAKLIVEDGPGGMTESDFTRVWKAEAQRDRRPNETPEMCFARHYSDPENYEKRRALDLLKGGSHEYYRKQRPPSPEEYYRGVEVAKSAPSAMEGFNHLAAQLRKADPSLTKEQAFDRVLTIRPILSFVGLRGCRTGP